MNSSSMKASYVQMPAGFDLRALPVVGSTNDVAREEAMKYPPVSMGNIVFWAEAQSGGRGRSGRSWASPAGNLYASILIQDVGELAKAAQLSFVTAISMRAAIARFAEKKQRVECKWPNDILVDGAKICGILLECGVNKTGQNWVVIGSGANVSHHPSETPYAAAHINQFNKDIEPYMLLNAYLEEFAQFFQIWKLNGFKEIREIWLQNCYGFGRNIVARLANNLEEHGRFLDMDEDGALILEREDRSRAAITAGDVFLKGNGDAASN
ncbi:biotin--[acetyl-CoA-carboxylase] ligase [Curvivirga sp.]|uniref:biotin--[acetyl-CoA-carboxylase] ligase n=1 Tax=Curvivirga sp. TaxID=2856848 RepID=UPI003B5A0E59